MDPQSLLQKKKCIAVELVVSRSMSTNNNGNNLLFFSTEYKQRWSPSIHIRILPFKPLPINFGIKYKGF